MLIEDYAFLSNLESAALVGRDGSIDWLCFPRFDSNACFAALLGDESHGRWLLAPAGGVRRATRRYRPGTLVLETDFETDDGAVRVVDCMPPDGAEHGVVRVVEGLEGRVPMRMQLAVRLDYGSVIPWVTNDHGAVLAVAGPDALRLWTYVETRGEDYTTVAEFEVRERERVPFLLEWHSSHVPAGPAADALHALARTQRFWEDWSERCTYDGALKEPVLGSLAVLKGLTYGPTGGIVAAPTTSLPEALGGERNWDYRYSWIRDSAFALRSLGELGFDAEVDGFRRFVERSAAGNEEDLQIVFGPGGERRLVEVEIGELEGYRRSRPVRVGNDAYTQNQHDVYGELLGLSWRWNERGQSPEGDYLRGLWGGG